MRFVFICLFLLAACGKDSAPQENAPTEFIATQGSFDGFESWKNFIVADPIINTVHAVTPREVFINQLPPQGSKEFPVGTIIVKESQAPADKTQWEVHAMVKRGNSYNATGALNWEWFDLSFNDDGSLNINWQGTAPPAGSGYTAPATGTTSAIDCNSCHTEAAANDDVQDTYLNLKTLQ